MRQNSNGQCSSIGCLFFYIQPFHVAPFLGSSIESAWARLFSMHTYLPWRAFALRSSFSAFFMPCEHLHVLRHISGGAHASIRGDARCSRPSWCNSSHCSSRQRSPCCGLQAGGKIEGPSASGAAASCARLHLQDPFAHGFNGQERASGSGEPLRASMRAGVAGVWLQPESCRRVWPVRLAPRVCRGCRGRANRASAGCACPGGRRRGQREVGKGRSGQEGGQAEIRPFARWGRCLSQEPRRRRWAHELLEPSPRRRRQQGQPWEPRQWQFVPSELARRWVKGLFVSRRQWEIVFFRCRTAAGTARDAGMSRRTKCVC
jgi:hypothetical protein